MVKITIKKPQVVRNFFFKNHEPNRTQTNDPQCKSFGWFLHDTLQQNQSPQSSDKLPGSIKTFPKVIEL